MKKPVRFREVTESFQHSVAVDRDQCVIRNVLALGAKSKNGRIYAADAMIAAVPLYEGVRVYVDHQPGGQQRSYRDCIGYLANASYRDGGIRADLHLNPFDPLTQKLLYDAEHRPHVVGLSHDASGKISTGPDGVTIVESIDEVFSVDLVTNPATTSSLFESHCQEKENMRLREQEPNGNGGNNGTAVDPLEALYQSLTLDTLKEKRPDLFDELRKQIQQELSQAMTDLKTQLDELRAKLDEYATAEQADQEMAEARIDVSRVPPNLRESVRREKNPKRRAALIEDIKKLLSQAGQAHSTNLFYLEREDLSQDPVEQNLAKSLRRWRV